MTEHDDSVIFIYLNSTIKQVLPPGSLVTEMVPPFRSVTAFAIARPKPKELSLLEASAL